MLKREGEQHMFEMCGSDLVFCEIFVGPKLSAEDFAKALSPLVAQWIESETLADEPDEAPVAALALWEGAPGECSVAGLFVVALDSFDQELLAVARAAAPDMFEIANSGNDNNPWDAFGEIPDGQPWTASARRAVARAISPETAKWLLADASGEYPKVCDALGELASTKEAQVLESAANKTEASSSKTMRM